MKTTGYSFLIKRPSLGVCLMAAYGQIAKGENMATSMLKPAAGTYAGGQWVRITSTTPGAVIRYTTDGSTVPSDTVGRIYRTPVMVNRTMSIRVAVSANGYTTNNSQATYTITRTAAQDRIPSEARAKRTGRNGHPLTLSGDKHNVRHAGDGKHRVPLGRLRLLRFLL